MENGKNKRKTRKNLLGLEIGSGGIKLVHGDMGKEQVTVRKIVNNALPGDVYTDGEISKPEVMVKTIKDTLKTNKIKAKDCYCCVDSGQIITREVTIPNLNKDSLQDMAKYEVEQYLPIEMENYTVQSVVTKEMEVDNKPVAEMLVTAFPKKLIAQIHEVISRAGLRPTVLDTQANAFGKLIENQYKINGNDYHRDSNAAFIDLGNESINIHLFNKGQFRFSRILHFGGKDLDVNIAKFMDMSIEDAKQRKRSIHNINYAVDEFSEEGKLIGVARASITGWLDEISKIFRYYSTRTGGFNRIEYIYIYGGLSNINGLTDFIESYFKVPVVQINKISSVDLQQSTDITEVLNTIGVLYRR